MAMHRLARLPLLAAAAGALALPAAASAAAPTDCPLQAPRAAKAIAVPGTPYVARDPYSGLLARNRLFFDFSLQGPKADLAKVAKVTWALDGTVVREDPRAPFEWKGVSGSEKRMPAGDHTITVTVVPAGGQPASVDFPLTATDCQFATFFAELPKAKGPTSLTWESAFESDDGAPLAGVAATAAKNVAVALPARLRGARIGTLKVTRGAGAGTKSYTLRGQRAALRRNGISVDFVPGAMRFLRVSGLPAGTQSIAVKLIPGIARVREPAHAFTVGGRLTGGTTSVSLTSRGLYV
jgi:hypothetical protein